MIPGKLKSLRRLKKILPGEIFLEPATLAKYAGDKWFATHQPDAVALPRSAKSVSTILRFANRHKIPVTPRGAGYGYVGGCVPVRGGIALSLERMNRIKEINAADFVAVVQPAVITAEFQDAVRKTELFYPPDPASRANNSIGGNIATNAGGPRCLKYGVTRDYVLGLEVVLADGTIVRLGGRTHKNKTGFDLHRLFVGSEGLLGVITEATLKLLPLPPFRANLAVGFPSMRDAIARIASDFRGRISAVRAGSGGSIHARRRRVNAPRSERLRGCKAHLIVELDGQKKFRCDGESASLKKLSARQKPIFVERGLGRRNNAKPSGRSAANFPIRCATPA